MLGEELPLKRRGPGCCDLCDRAQDVQHAADWTEQAKSGARSQLCSHQCCWAACFLAPPPPPTCSAWTLCAVLAYLRRQRELLIDLPNEDRLIYLLVEGIDGAPQLNFDPEPRDQRSGNTALLVQRMRQEVMHV